RRLDTDERRLDRPLIQSVLPARGRNTRDVRDLVLPSVGAKRVEAPDLFAAGLIAKRLEGNGRFDGPAAFEPPGLHIPDRVPVAVPLSLVRHLAVIAGAE